MNEASKTLNFILTLSNSTFGLLKSVPIVFLIYGSGKLTEQLGILIYSK